MTEEQGVISQSFAEEVSESCKEIAAKILEENKDLSNEELGKKVIKEILEEINFTQDHEIHQVYLTVYDVTMSNMDPRAQMPGQPRLRRKERYLLPMLITNKNLALGHVVKIHPQLDQIGPKPVIVTGVHQVLYDRDRHPKNIELAKEFIDDYDGYEKYRKFMKEQMGWDTEQELLAKIQKGVSVLPTDDKSEPASDSEDATVEVDPPKPTLVEPEAEEE